MAVWYSDHFGTDGVSDIALATQPHEKLMPEASHGRLRRKTAYFEGLPLITEVVRLMSLKSSDNIFAIRHSASGGTAGVADLGLYLAGVAHAGAVVDADLFASATAINGTIDFTDVMFESTVLTPDLRGKKLWQLASASAGVTDMTVDPKVIYDLCYTVTTSATTANTKIVVCVDYIAGD